MKVNASLGALRGIVTLAGAAGLALGTMAPSAAASGAGLPRLDPYAVSSGRLTLARAPRGLQAAVRMTLGVRAPAAASRFHRTTLTASGGAAGDLFGYSVAVSGSTAVVGAYAANSYTGAAYVFTRSGRSWSQQAVLTASGGAPGDQFGWSVAVSGSTAVVGAPVTNSQTGAAYVFTEPAGGWVNETQQAVLTASDGAEFDEFGDSVAVSGSTAVVGADGKDADTGAAYVFTEPAGGWANETQQAVLTASDGAVANEFGDSVAIDGSTAVVGARGWAGARGESPYTGAAYVFVQSGTAWSQQAELTASDGAANDQFGFSVAISGATVVVGAPGGETVPGAAYVFAASGTAWSQQAELTASNPVAGDQFGISVAIFGATAMVGADGENAGEGAAYMFAGSGMSWSQQAKLTISGPAQFGVSVAIAGAATVVGADGGDSGTGAAYAYIQPTQQAALAPTAPPDVNIEYGYSVAISGSTAVVGAPGYPGVLPGAAYVFAGSGTSWSEQAVLTEPSGADYDEFGYSVAISGSTIVVGAPGVNNDSGAVYVFYDGGLGWAGPQTIPDPGGGGGFGSSVAISGATMVAGAANTVYIFTGAGGDWSEQAALPPPAGSGAFGYSVATDGPQVMVGAPDGNGGTGAAYVYTLAGTSWSQQATLSDPSGASGEGFGDSVAISGSTAVAGAPFKNNLTGTALIFTRSGTTWNKHVKLTDPAPTQDGEFGYSVAIDDSIVTATGNGVAYVYAGAATIWTRQARLALPSPVPGDYGFTQVAISGSTVVATQPETPGVGGLAYVFTNV
jgi:hypothetical protein